ncbi:MAG: glycosyl hydrolase family 17 protein [Gammaproteobacteria bacterium]|nr:glycosyl hydrolase family 17 protein [Gammaproteobacteria bacterium]MDH3374950.1 glycosyl hydrolase family 17 protein [Gammaproteobacteria bacterium]MDH3409908.1 glycosyl hydrolase family 17 protein [Gammaproteobacteria bacterium]MDH3554170.1 glycosyl hydrolase family 17 protein [Gammaproteobacteria bacterium]
MGVLHRRQTNLAGINVAVLSEEELRRLVKEILDEKIHGISFSPYVEGQGPGTQIGEAQIRERLAFIQDNTHWIRTFSCSEGNELIPAIAKEAGLGTMVGVWLDGNREQNEIELANAIELANSGYVDILGVGNEVLLRGDLSEDELIDYVNRAKDAVSGVPVGYVDAYFEFAVHPRVTEACDVILANCYPFWEGCQADYALLYMKEMYRLAVNVANGKKVIVSETGWPNIGTAEGGAVPSFENAIKYFVDTHLWAEEDEVEVFWFSSFDETWKVDAEGDVGAYWGLWDKDGNPKYV